jgi:lipoprotein-anchoring transpeptidase ErfK/SrfK
LNGRAGRISPTSAPDQGNADTLYRIHGNPDERTIGQAVSSGCVRLLPQDVIHLHDAVRSGSALLVV